MKSGVIELHDCVIRVEERELVSKGKVLVIDVDPYTIELNLEDVIKMATVFGKELV